MNLSPLDALDGHSDGGFAWQRRETETVTRGPWEEPLFKTRMRVCVCVCVALESSDGSWPLVNQSQQGRARGDSTSSLGVELAGVGEERKKFPLEEFKRLRESLSLCCL